jgi:hypothetical protein
MTKSEKNAQIQAATELFLMNGGKINVIPPKKVKVRVTCSGRMKSANTGGGDAPKFNISSLYFQGDNSGASNA